MTTQPLMSLDQEKEILISFAEAFQRSSHILVQEPGQTTSQMVAQLLASDHPMIQSLIREGVAKKKSPWLRPLTAPSAPSAARGNPMVRTITDHEGEVLSLAITPDGQWMLSASGDKTVRVWDHKTGALVKVLQEHKSDIQALAVTPDSARLITGSGGFVGNDNTIKVWDLTSLKVIKTLHGHTDWVRTLAVTSDGRRLLSGSNDKTIIEWDLQTWNKVRTYTGHSDLVREIAITEDDTKFVSASHDQTVKVWDLNQGKEWGTFSGHRFDVDSAVIIPPGRMVASGSLLEIKIWDIDSLEEIVTLKGHNNSVTALGVTPDGKMLISGSKDNQLKLWDLETYTEIASVGDHSDVINAITVSPDGRFLLTGSGSVLFEENEIKIWNLTKFGGSQSHIPGVEKFEGGITKFAKSPVNEDLFGATGVGSILGWNFKTLKQKSRFTTDEGAGIRDLAITADGKTLASAGDDWCITLWDLETGKDLKTLVGHSERINHIAMTADDRCIISSSFDNSLKFWHLRTGLELSTMLGANPDLIDALAISPDGTHVVAGYWDGTVRIWDLRSYKEEHIFSGHKDRVYVLAISPDGQLIASGSRDKTIKVWDLHEKTEFLTFAGHADYVQLLAFTPDGTRLVSSALGLGDLDTSIKVWDLRTGKLAFSFNRHKQYVLSFDFSPDGRYCVSASRDGTLRVWDLVTGEQTACFSAEASLSATLFAKDGMTVATGTENKGAIRFLRLENIRPGPPIVTPVRRWQHQLKRDAQGWEDDIVCTCPNCGQAVQLPQDVHAEIQILSGNSESAQRQIAILSLDKQSWYSPKLLVHCDRCNSLIKVNPFVVDGRKHINESETGILVKDAGGLTEEEKLLENYTSKINACHFQDALDSIDTLQTINPEEPLYKLLRITPLLGLERYDEVLIACENLITGGEIHGEDLGTVFYLEGHALVGLQRFEDGVASLSVAKQFIKNPDIDMELGNLYLNIGEYQKAQIYYKSYIDQGNPHPRALWGMGLALVSQEKYQEACVYLKKFVENPGEVNPVNVNYAKQMIDKISSS